MEHTSVEGSVTALPLLMALSPEMQLSKEGKAVDRVTHVEKLPKSSSLTFFKQLQFHVQRDNGGSGASALPLKVCVLPMFP